MIGVAAAGEAVDDMGYLKRGRSQIILAAFLLTSLLLAAFPAVDLGISGYVFNGGSFSVDQWWQALLHDSLNWFLCGSLGTVIAIYAVNRLSGRSIAGITGRKVVYLL